MNTHSTLLFLKLSACSRVNLKQTLLSSLLVRQRTKPTRAVELGTDRSGQFRVHKESQGMLGKSAIALTEPLKWNEMRLKVPKLTETINNHRETETGLLTTAKHGQLGAPPCGEPSVASRPSLREHCHRWATSCHCCPHPADGSSASVCFVGLRKLCQRASGREGLGCVRSSSSAWQRQGAAVLCCAVLCRRMWWGDTDEVVLELQQDHPWGSSSAAGQGSCTGQL